MPSGSPTVAQLDAQPLGLRVTAVLGVPSAQVGGPSTRHVGKRKTCRGNGG